MDACKAGLLSPAKNPESEIAAVNSKADELYFSMDKNIIF